MMSEKNKEGQPTGGASKSALPELLAPAGSRLSLEAALEAGADAVYFGGGRHNARARAQNFEESDISAAVDLVHAHRKKAYFTLNTLVSDRELPELIEQARIAAAAGVDALIVADLGGGALIRRHFPELPLHASTQMSAHNSAAGEILAGLGFSRMVCAREMPLCNLRSFVKNTRIEAEVFVHGALCVSHSGQCLFSSMVGGRSGNRGECAQPCRLPFMTGPSGTSGTSGSTGSTGSTGKPCSAERYPLSLSDLSLARHIPALINSGIKSLKIEGRMKPPEYVLAVTRTYRRLLDERRAAADDEIEYLATVFSRGGFTDAYFTGNIGRGMLGVRTVEDKEASRALEPFRGLTKKPTLDLSASILPDTPISLTAASGGISVNVTGEIPEAARNKAAERDYLLRNLTKLGATPYSAGNISLELGERLALPSSKLNALRRAAVDALAAARRPIWNESDVTPDIPPAKKTRSERSARFIHSSQIPEEAEQYFDIIYLPLDEFIKSPGASASGVILPPVIFDSELEGVREQLQVAVGLGAAHALLAGLGQISLAREFGLVPHGDFRLNVTNSSSVAVCMELGFDDVILSPELTLPQIRDIEGDTQVIVYGRIPLMLLEKCVAKDTSGCAACRAGRAELIDRRGISFPVLRQSPHRNIIYNSLPTYMADRQPDLERAGVTSRHFLFSTESAGEVAAVIAAYKEEKASPGAVRRI